MMALSLMLAAIYGMPDDNAWSSAVNGALPRIVKLYGLGVGSEVPYGTGILVSGDGEVLTVLSLLVDARRVTAVTADGRRFRAEVVRRDEDRQLALLHLVPLDQAEAPAAPDTSREGAALPAPPVSAATGKSDPPSSGPATEFPFFEMNPTPSPSPGDWVLALGNAFRIAEQAEPVSITQGICAGTVALDATRRARDFPYHGPVLLVDAMTANPGLPGGALIDLEGRLLGMIGKEVTSSRTNTYLNYAMPVETLRAFLRSDPLAPTPGEPAKGWTEADLGIRMSRTGFRTVLPFVERVTRGSIAETAGLKVDDLVLAFNGKSVSTLDDWEDALKNANKAQPLTLIIQRGNSIMTLTWTPP